MVLLVLFAAACGGGGWVPDREYSELRGKPVFQVESFGNIINISEAAFDELAGCGFTPDVTEDQISIAVRLMERHRIPLETITNFGGRTSEDGDVESSYYADVTITKSPGDMYIIVCSQE